MPILFFMSYDGIILQHYKKIAKTFGLSSKSTMEDQFIRKSETDFIKSVISTFIKSKKKQIEILDVGCGNGYLLTELKNKFPKAKLSGIEFTPELYELAISRQLNSVKIINGDIRATDCWERKQDVIITERTIINILVRKQQYLALKNISNLLKKNGIYIMIESFIEPRINLDNARSEFKLPPLKKSNQNKYISEAAVAKIQEFGLKEITSEYDPNFLSTHFYITRVFHKILKPEGSRVKFTEFESFFKHALPNSIGNYSPILFRVFKKV